MLSNVYDICTVIAHLRVSHAQEQSVRIHQPYFLILLLRIIIYGAKRAERNYQLTAVFISPPSNRICQKVNLSIKFMSIILSSNL